VDVARVRQRIDHTFAASGLCVEVLVEPGRRDEDRVFVDWRDDALLVVVADGAGNSGRGARAADAAAARFDGATQDRVVELDAELAGIGAEAALFVARVEVYPDGLRIDAAAAGDVRAWTLRGDEWTELTRGVARKPLVGSGARASALRAARARALLVASDGLAAWSGPELDPPTTTAPLDALLDRVRARAGPLGDDVSIVRVTLA
jgi:hypothetical protein